MDKHAFGILLLIVLALLRVASTYPRLSHTADEPAHLACGLEWWERGAYTYEPQHPPLARIAAATGPYFAGRRLPPGEIERLERHAAGTDLNRYTAASGFTESGLELLLARGYSYLDTLTLARLGVLPFFALLLAAVAVWAWPISRTHALLAVLLASTTPMLLGHAGLATTDMAFTAFAVAGLAAFHFWLEKPGWKTAAWLGATWGMAFLSKFSALLFLPVGAAAVWLTWFFVDTRLPRPPLFSATNWTRRAGTLAGAAAAAFLLTWSMYRFSAAPLAGPESRPHAEVDLVFGKSGPMHSLAYYLIESVSIPAPEALHGLLAVLHHSAEGHKSYFLGEYGAGGWLLFFPVLLLVKTPIPILLLSAVGTGLAVRGRAWRALAPLAAAVAIVAVSLPATINIGSRHVLPVYALLCLSASYAVPILWRRKAGKAAVAALLSWHLIGGAAAHPDYPGFFNAFAGGNPERIVADSDLDWGQGMVGLTKELQNRGIEEFWVVGYGDQGAAVCRALGMPRARDLSSGQRVSGWVAIVEFKYKDVFGEAPHDGYAWLQEYETVDRVGRGLRLIYVPFPDSERPGG